MSELKVKKYNVEFSSLKGLVFSSIEITDDYRTIFFKSTCDRIFWMKHDQNCCESVYLEDVCGDLKDIINSEILLAEEVRSRENPEDRKNFSYESFTWTFYKLATIKGYVTLRWLGTSNGYYSESVSIDECYGETLQMIDGIIT